ncbi:MULTISPECIES: hypothetical protein [Roseomonadaceae]|uniref:Uncharacterized protein n=1 Tax=Falsiroseomonas oleicola TaxID=2801474 RepID=A0ABS6HBI8_9PROT|nr:hypothetical protein [Roseomonas oleicola]MBU8545048.1 hypothetical protein [Roseomonas oleicola]
MTFTADDARGWLATGGVTGAGTADCEAVADLLNAWKKGQDALSELDDMNAKTKLAFDEARRAVTTLRRELPTVLAHFMAVHQTGSLLGGDPADIVAEGKKVANLLAAVHAADVRWPEVPFVTDWHNLAGVLLLEYQRITGKGSTSKNGRAVRFIQEALCAVGEDVSLSAIESAFDARNGKPPAPFAEIAARKRHH